MSATTLIGATPNLQGVSKNVTPIFLYIFIRINASVLCFYMQNEHQYTVLCFIWVEIGGPPILFKLLISTNTMVVLAQVFYDFLFN